MMIVVDVETTGINPNKHSIVSIGAVDFCNPKRTFYQECRIWEGAKVVKEALDLNGFTYDEIIDSNKPSAEEAAKAFIVWSEDCENLTLAGVNPFFDRDFIKHAAYLADAEWPFGYRAIDLHTLCYAHHLKRNIIPPVKNKRTAIISDTTFQYVGLPVEPKPHNALTGAIMEAESFSRLLHGKILFDNFKQFELPSYLK